MVKVRFEMLELLIYREIDTTNISVYSEPSELWIPYLVRPGAFHKRRYSAEKQYRKIERLRELRED